MAAPEHRRRLRLAPRARAGQWRVCPARNGRSTRKRRASRRRLGCPETGRVECTRHAACDEKTRTNPAHFDFFLPIFAGLHLGLHYWQSCPWAAFDDAAAASTSRKRNIALRGCQGAAVGLRPGCRKNGNYVGRERRQCASSSAATACTVRQRHAPPARGAAEAETADQIRPAAALLVVAGAAARVHRLRSGPRRRRSRGGRAAGEGDA